LSHNSNALVELLDTDKYSFISSNLATPKPHTKAKQALSAIYDPTLEKFEFFFQHADAVLKFS